MNEELYVGLDFGTTTSVLSYFENGSLKAFEYGDRSGRSTPYVPSVVAYTDYDLFIGRDADLSLLPDGGRQYRYFKMLLPETERANWLSLYGPYEVGALAPADIAADFIGQLLNGQSPNQPKRFGGSKSNDYSFRKRQNRPVEGIVVSVPQIWRDWKAHGRQQLQTVVNALGISLLQLISEPVAAAAYFAYKYHRDHEEPYEGNLLVCDMGGGTFDVALCGMSPESVDVLCNYGNGQRGLGLAGAYFDHELLKPRGSESWDPKLLARTLMNLDKAKKDTENSQRLSTYLALTAEQRTEAIYQIISRSQLESFTFEDVRQAFTEIRNGIHEVLKTVRDEAERGDHEIDKVVLVGGFSKFPLVQQAIAEFFGEELFDQVLVDIETLPPEDMAFAISYGACLIANNQVSVSEKYEHGIGVTLFNSSGREPEQIELIAAGKPLDALQDVNYCRRPDGQERRISIKKAPIQVDLSIKRSGQESGLTSRTAILSDLPGAEIPGNRWYLGAFVDSSKVPHLVMRSEKGNEKPRDYPIGDLI